MTPYIQLYKHDPENNIYGDCYRTALGCLLDTPPEEVPHFCEFENWEDLTNNWLKTKGYKRFVIAYQSIQLDNILKFLEFHNKDIYYILIGRSSSNVDHAFIGCGGKIVHDPSGREELPTGSCEDDLYWIEILVPIQTCKF